MIKFLKNILYPLRFVLTKLILKNEINDNSPINLAAQYIISEGITGDYYEFGCFKGASFIKAYKLINFYKNEWSNYGRTLQAYSDKNLAKQAFEKLKIYDVKFYVFDSFKGLPNIKNIDQNHPIFSKGRYDCSREDFEKNLIRNKISLNKINIVEGFYEETLNENNKINYNMNKASIIMIDCDLYHSAKLVLDFITDIVQNGTVLIFDDWYAYRGNPNKGEQLATKEWLNKNKNISLIPFSRFGVYQQSFIVNINE